MSYQVYPISLLLWSFVVPSIPAFLLLFFIVIDILLSSSASIKIHTNPLPSRETPEDSVRFSIVPNQTWRFITLCFCLAICIFFFVVSSFSPSFCPSHGWFEWAGNRVGAKYMYLNYILLGLLLLLFGFFRVRFIG